MIEVISEVTSGPSGLILIALICFFIGAIIGWRRGYRVATSDESHLFRQTARDLISEHIETDPDSRHRA